MVLNTEMVAINKHSIRALKCQTHHIQTVDNNQKGLLRIFFRNEIEFEIPPDPSTGIHNAWMFSRI